MESNFIKERVVIRQKLIKDNLKAQQSSSKQACQSSKSADLTATPPDNVVAFEELINERLKQDLADILKQVDVICEIVADYLKIKSAIKIFKTKSKDLRLQTNIGCNFYAQCCVEDASKIYLSVGKDIYLLMTLDEALEMIKFKEKQWTRRLDVLQEKAAKINAYIKIALEAMGKLYEINRDKLTSD